MSTIKFLQITLEPWRFSDKHSELRFKVDFGYKNVNYIQALDPTDMESHFDFIFERAKRALRTEIDKAIKETA